VPVNIPSNVDSTSVAIVRGISMFLLVYQCNESKGLCNDDTRRDISLFQPRHLTESESNRCDPTAELSALTFIVAFPLTCPENTQCGFSSLIVPDERPLNDFLTPKQTIQSSFSNFIVCDNFCNSSRWRSGPFHPLEVHSVRCPKTSTGSTAQM
jgi:hypothetical protein